MNHNSPLGCFNTSLCYLRDFWSENPFEASNEDESGSFRRAAIAAGKLIAVPAGDFMYATIHPGNTSARVIGEGWEEVAG